VCADEEDESDEDLKGEGVEENLLAREAAEQEDVDLVCLR